jgi:hypothetical protein
VVAEHFAAEQPHLRPLPAGPVRPLLRLDRRITWDDMVSVGGNLCLVPDSTRKRLAKVHCLPRAHHRSRFQKARQAYAGYKSAIARLPDTAPWKTRPHHGNLSIRRG